MEGTINYIEEKAKLIMGEHSNERSINNMISHIEGRTKSSYSFGVEAGYIENYDIIELESDSIRFNYTLSEIYDLAEKYTNNTIEDIENTIITALDVCGIRVRDNEGLRNVRKASSGYKAFERFLRVPAIIGNKRLTMRVVPAGWGEEDSPLSTKFYLNGRDIYIDGKKVAEVAALSTAITIQNLAYITKSACDEYILTLNPNQACYQDCKFCFKGFHHMTNECKSTLIRLSPEQMCKYIEVEMPDIDFAEITEIAILTSRFFDSKQLLEYVEKFISEILKISKGKFNPIKNPNQRIKISTHLLNSETAMISAKRMGVQRYIYPIEAFNDTVRKNIMTTPKLAENKGDVPFDEIMKILEKASAIFGKENIEPVIIIGLDTYEDTIKGVKRLKDAGYTLLTRSNFRIYDKDQFNLYRMNLEEIIAVNEEINKMFPIGYKQVVELNNKKVNNLYKI